ncbi:MAG: OmpA family protein [Bacteroidota bacterium]
MKQVFLMLSLWQIHLVTAQNLIPNPSFEDQWSCQLYHTTRTEPIKAKYWYSPSTATPDLFSTCSPFDVAVPRNFMGLAYPVDGDSYVGMYFRRNNQHSSGHYREYLSCRLLESPKAGEVYIFSFFSRPSSLSNQISNVLTYAFTPDSVIVDHDNILENVEYQIVSVDTLGVIEGWYKVYCEFIATGEEAYLTIGDFIPDGEGGFERRLGTRGKNVNYYYFDHFTLERKFIEPEEYEVEKPFSLNRIFFEFDSYVLNDSAFLELHGLANYLIEHVNLGLEIYGNTDEKGTEVYNDQLSLQRAKSVKAALEHFLVPPERMQVFGLGERESIYQFDSLNRRTKFVLVEIDNDL